MDIENRSYSIDPGTHEVTRIDDSTVLPPPDRNQLLEFAGITVTQEQIDEADAYLVAHPGYGAPQHIAWR